MPFSSSRSSSFKSSYSSKGSSSFGSKSKTGSSYSKPSTKSSSGWLGKSSKDTKPKANLKKSQSSKSVVGKSKTGTDSKSKSYTGTGKHYNSNSKTVNNHYYNNTATDWLPFMFMAGMMNHHQTVVVNGTPQTQTYNPNPVAEGISILITLIAFTVIGTILWKLFKPKKKKAWKKW
ncbi:hypothetical protein [Bacillus sp. NPDC077027]|uniref:hypothetical protein n=1 Tax=Bacillus sp. NPDC077027 TaxID=3390548 RepID=UPI003D042CB2